MSQIELVGNVDDQHRLSLVVPEQIKVSAVKVILEIADDGEDDWRDGVAQIWARDWSDPHEDVYTLNDGNPVPS